MRKASESALAQARLLIDHHNRFSTIRGDVGRDAILRTDADETNMLALQLEQMRSRVYEDVHTILKARQFLPVANDIDTGAESFAFEVTDYVGEAKIISNYADDLPTVETKGEKVTHAILSLGDSYHYSIQDIRRAAFSGKPLNVRKAIAARRLWERKLDDIAASGAASAGIPTGILNNANVGTETVAAPGVWSGKTAKQMLDDMNKLVRGLVTTSKEHYMGDSLLLSLADYLLFSQTRFSVDNSETAMEAFMRANPGIRSIEPWLKLEGAGAGGVNRAILYTKDPEVLELVIPQEFEVLPPQPKNLAFNVLCHGRTAGCCIYRPLGVRYMDLTA